MAKIYSIEVLRSIHAKKEAGNGVKYQTADDRVEGCRYFIGNENGHLDEITDVTLIDGNTINIESNDVDIAALQAEVIRLEAVKADKCFVVATNIFLG